MGIIRRDLAGREPFWIEHDGSRYLVDPFDEAVETAGMQCRVDARAEYERKGLDPKLFTKAKALFYTRVGEVSEMLRGWENVMVDDGSEAEFTNDNIVALLVGDANLVHTLYARAFLRQQEWEDEKKVSAVSPNGIGGGSTEGEDENTANNA